MMSAEQLKNKILTGNMTNDEWLSLRKEVQDFLESDISESEKKLLSGYTEKLAMICKGIESMVK